MKVAIFENTEYDKLEKELNEFLEDKTLYSVIKDIKYTSYWAWRGNWEDSYQCYSALVMYE